MWTITTLFRTLSSPLKSTPLKILANNSKKHPIVSNLVIGLLEYEKYNNGITHNETFKDIASKLLSKNNDIILNSITISDNEISLDNSYLFKGYNSAIARYKRCIG